jgi:hypothetical protein
MTTEEDLGVAMGVVEKLAGEIGGRRPTGPGERAAAERLAGFLDSRGIDVRLEGFRGYASFAEPFSIILALAVAPALVPRARRMPRMLLALGAVVGLAGEGSLLRAPISRALSRRRSQTVVATIEPSGSADRILCLVAHMDTSRSGLLFHPRLVPLMSRWIAVSSLLVLAAAAVEPFAARSPAARRSLGAIRAGLAAGLGLLAEREVRGVDVPGANDNASGCGVVMALAARLAADPLRATRVVVLITGCEESGTLGARAFRDSQETGDWMFLNFDNVGGPGSVRVLRREGVIMKWDADPGLIATAAAVADRRGDLRMAPEDSPAGLTYDSSPIHAAGGRALTISVQDGFIPDLHWPTDVFENVDPDGVRRTLEAGAELLVAIDRGDADRDRGRRIV